LQEHINSSQNYPDINGLLRVTSLNEYLTYWPNFIASHTHYASSNFGRLYFLASTYKLSLLPFSYSFYRATLCWPGISSWVCP